jgi:hypothetical protein
MNRTMRILGLVVAASAAACAGGPNPGEGPLSRVPDPTLGVNDGPLLGTTGGTPGNTFDHEMDDPDPFAALERIQEQGPPEISTRMHSCQKMKYDVLGTVLASLGVNLGSTGTPPTAGQLYRGGAQAMGGPNYGARVAETIELTAAGATKLFDIFVQAAPEIIAAMPNADRCKVAGQPTSMFDAQGHCTLAGITCLQGSPATADQVALCNQALTEGSTPTIGQAIAVASILSAAHTCE